MSHLSDRQSEISDRSCPQCGEPLEHHRQIEVASAVVGSPEHTQLMNLIGERRWSEALGYNAANAIHDIRVWRLLSCRDGGAVITPVVMPIEVWSDDKFEEPVPLSSEELRSLMAAIDEKG